MAPLAALALSAALLATQAAAAPPTPPQGGTARPPVTEVPLPPPPNLKARLPRVLVLDFAVQGEAPKELGRTLADVAVREISSAGGFKGAAWTQLGTGALSSATVPAAAPKAASGTTRVTWTETDGAGTTAKTSAWSGSSWSTPVAGGFGINGLTNGLPLATSTGTMHLLTVTAAGRVQVLYWVPYAYPVPGHWQQLGADLNAGAGAGSDAVFALDPAGEPVAAWYEAATTTGTWARRHDAVAGWPWLTSVALSSRPVHLAVSSGGVIVLAKSEAMGLSMGLRVLRYNR